MLMQEHKKSSLGHETNKIQQRRWPSSWAYRHDNRNPKDNRNFMGLKYGGIFFYARWSIIMIS